MRRCTAEEQTTSKIQSASSRDVGKTARDEDDDDEEYQRIVGFINRTYEGPIEGFDWDEDTIDEKIDHYSNQLNPGLPGQVFRVCYEEPQLKELNERLALYRIRALNSKELQNLEDADLRRMYPALEDADLRRMYPALEDQGYFEFLEDSFEWYFDKDYCHYACLQDYQRLMLRNYGEYEDDNWEYYRETCSTLESDQQFVLFWEELEKKIKWVKPYMGASTDVWKRLEAVAYYHALKIAVGFPKIFKPLVFSGYSDYIWDADLDRTCVKYYIDFFYAIWTRVTQKKMDYKEALRKVYEEGDHSSIFRSDIKAELEKLDGKKIGGPGHLQRMYEKYVAEIDEGVTEDMFRQLMRPVVRNTIIRRKVYYDYVKAKLDIAKEIGAIKPSQNCGAERMLLQE